MKNGYKLYYTLLSFRGYVFFLTLEREYIADKSNFRYRSFKLIVEKPTNPNPRKTKPKVFISINQNKG